MAVSPKKKKKADNNAFLVNGIIVAAFLAGIGFMAYLLMGDPGSVRKETFHEVKLLKPPPPPEQKPPEPEVPKEVPKQEIVEDIPQQDQPQNDQPQDNTPAGQDLGVDAEGGAGSDGFGLVGKKGGRGLIGGGSGGLSRTSLLAKYGWYTKKVEKEIWSRVKQLLDKDGGIPKGKHQLTVHLLLNGSGDIVGFRVIDRSGNDAVDKAVQSALPSLKVSEPPPAGMPYGMTLRIAASQG